ncbi:MAG: hypothetical protein GY769_18565 [bacterium]|nr:hypothetical protein [bacterium]
MTAKHDFSTLTIADLLEARDAYHRHTTHLPTIVGTGIGRYLIRRDDPDFKEPSTGREKPRDEVRTLQNSDLTSWSDPCVLVFVNKWKTPAELQDKPEQYVPSRLYLPDDRVIPTCVVLATPEAVPGEAIADIHFAPQLLGGGYPILSEVQGQTRMGSVGCLVTDGHSVFALTSRHVAGPENQPSYTVIHGEPYEVGESREPSAALIKFSKAYPGWPGFRTLLQLDAGLVRVHNLNEWTSQVYGVGEIGPLVDLDPDSFSLDLVGRNARAFGAVSGSMTGRIYALFYRYRSRAGIDFVTDFLIGPAVAGGSLGTHRGDSGTLWFFDPPEDDGKYRPFAVQWGSSSFDLAEEESTSFALASNLTIISRELGVRLVSDWETGLPETWGKLGHYEVGAKACDLVAHPKLYKLLQENKELIGLSDDDRLTKKFPKSKQAAFIALADVPDLWWKTYRGKEKPSHFADMDEEGQGDFQGETLMSRYLDDPTTLDPATWLAFYQSIGTEQKYQGSLPFRVQQFYEEMVGFVRDRKIAEYVAAAGILAHYIGDAAQPLHTSRLHHGHNESEAGVHAQYETSMVERYRSEIVQKLNERLEGWQIASSFSGGRAAARATIDLAYDAIDLLSPEEIIDSYNAAGEGLRRNEDLWRDLGEATLDILELGAFYLAEIWESAWLEGGGNQVAQAELKRISKTRLMSLYKRKTFLESKWLEEMV